jgi:hypothetical protein
MPPGRDYSQQRNTGGSVSSGETLVVLYDAASSIRDFVAVCRDSSGNFSAESRIALDPADLQPAVAINEVMANPEGLDSAGEYIELANYGGDIISLAGWRIGRCEEPEKSLVLGDEGLSPGQFILITSDKAEAERFPWEARLVRLKGGPIPGGISNSKSEKICLYEPEGMEVSSYRGWLIPEEGRSIERIDSAFPDYAGIWRQSAEKGGSPGKMNGSPK